MKMNKIITVCLITASSLAFASMTIAATPGSYIGLGLGGSNVPSPNIFAATTSTTTMGFAGRAFGGYNVNRNFGVEAGYAYYKQASANVSSGGASASLTRDISTINLVGKAYLPLEDNFDLYALGGGAMVLNKVGYTNSGVPVNAGVSYAAGTAHMISPELGAGAMYAISNQLSTGVEYSYIFSGHGNTNTNSTATPGSGLLTVDLSYYFG